MTLNEKYRIHNKPKSNKLLILYILILILYSFSNSFSRYTTSNYAEVAMNIANWCIKVNDNQIDQNTKIIKNEVKLIVTDNKTDDNLIKPGQKGYFDIVIDPQYTEVSLEYKITIDTSGLPNGINLTKYSINNFTNTETFPQNKELKGRILLDGESHLDDTDKKIYRIYWEWNQSEAKIEDLKDDYKVKANIQIEQMI